MPNNTKRPVLLQEDARLILKRLVRPTILESEISELSLMHYRKARFGVEIECAAPYDSLNQAAEAIVRDLQDKVPNIVNWLAKDDCTIQEPSSLPVHRKAQSPEEVLAAYVFKSTDDVEKRVELMQKIKQEKAQWDTDVASAMSYIQSAFGVGDTAPFGETHEDRGACSLEFVTPGGYRDVEGGLPYSAQGLNEVKAVLDYMEREGFVAGREYHTGLHVHFSVDSQHLTTFNLLALAYAVYRGEERLYKRWPYRKTSGYSESIKSAFRQDCIPVLNKMVDAVRLYDKQALQKHLHDLTVASTLHELFDWGHYSALNIGDAVQRHGTVEFRYAVGMIDSAAVVSWIRECAEFVGEMLDKQIDYKGIIIKEKVPGERYVVVNKATRQQWPIVVPTGR